MYSYEARTGNAYSAAWSAVMAIADEGAGEAEAIIAAAQKFAADVAEITGWVAKINRSLH